MVGEVSDMGNATSPIEFLMEARGNLSALAPLKIILKQNIPSINLPSFKIDEQAEGTSLEVPRWVGEILINLGLAYTPNEGFEVELFKSLSRERMQGPLQLSTLKKDFYVNLKVFLEDLSKKARSDPKFVAQLEKDAAAARDLMRYRVQKLLYIASASALPVDLVEKTTPEEQKLVEAVKSLIKGWLSSVIGEA
ncbi:MAG: hypothetical protein QXW32_04805 [Nitrososphaerales archaeon]